MLHQFAHYVALSIEVIAIATIAWGALEAVIGIAAVMSRTGATNQDRRHVWLVFARWLVVIAVIRTFLSFFLDRELADTRDLQRLSREPSRSQ